MSEQRPTRFPIQEHRAWLADRLDAAYGQFFDARDAGCRSLVITIRFQPRSLAARFVQRWGIPTYCGDPGTGRVNVLATCANLDALERAFKSDAGAEADEEIDGIAAMVTKGTGR